MYWNKNLLWSIIWVFGFQPQDPRKYQDFEGLRPRQGQGLQDPRPRQDQDFESSRPRQSPIGLEARFSSGGLHLCI